MKWFGWCVWMVAIVSSQYVLKTDIYIYIYMYICVQIYTITIISIHTIIGNDTRFLLSQLNYTCRALCGSSVVCVVLF